MQRFWKEAGMHYRFKLSSVTFQRNSEGHTETKLRGRIDSLENIAKFTRDVVAYHPDSFRLNSVEVRRKEKGFVFLLAVKGKACV